MIVSQKNLTIVFMKSFIGMDITLIAVITSEIFPFVNPIKLHRKGELLPITQKSKVKGQREL